jgi:amino acid permease
VMDRTLSYVLAGVVFAIAAYDYLWLKDLGFPDGWRSELDRARIPLYKIFITLSIFCGAYLIYLGAKASDRQRGMRLLIVALLYLLIIAVTMLVDWHFSTYLRGGGGG